MRLRRAGIGWMFILWWGVVGCAAPEPVVVPAPERAAAPAGHEALYATLWVQTSAEYAATALQAYRTAARMLDAALADDDWTAALEQLQQDGYDDLPPAVVLDVDETVLDNAAYQARLITRDVAYSAETWDAWVQEAAAVPVPGAVAFTQYAHERGVRVFYLTNRRSHLEAATRRNLAAYGFPLAEGEDVVITRGEQPAWAASDKGPRRAALVDRYRILLLVGDNLGDFLSDVEQAPAARAALVEPYEDFWGTRWIMLPNPQYGSWEGALFDFDYSRSPAERLQRQYEALDTTGVALPTGAPD